MTIAASSGSCEDVYANAQLAQQAAGVSDVAYQHAVFVFPAVGACLWAGQAEIGGRYVWINGAFEARVLAHELGHNLGLAHAGGLYCTSGATAVILSSTCDARNHAYDDPFDAMGRAPVVRQMSMQHKLELRLLPSAAVKVVGASGDYRLAPMETLTPGLPELLRIPKPGGGSYYVEYRAPLGFFDGQAPPLHGVLIRTDVTPVTGNDPDTALIDMHPATAGNWSDAAMDVGQEFSDPLSGVVIANAAQDAGGATLRLNVPRDTVPPSAPGGLTAVAGGTTVALHWTAASDDYAVESYRVTRDGVQVADLVATDFTDNGLVPGTTVAYKVEAVDAGGNLGPPASAGLAIPDGVPRPRRRA